MIELFINNMFWFYVGAIVFGIIFSIISFRAIGPFTFFWVLGLILNIISLVGYLIFGKEVMNLTNNLFVYTWTNIICYGLGIFFLILSWMKIITPIKK